MTQEFTCILNASLVHCCQHGEGKKKKVKCKELRIWALWGVEGGDILTRASQRILYNSTYRSLGQNTFPDTWKKHSSKNLSTGEGSEGMRKDSVSTVFKVAKSSGVSLHSQPGFLSALQGTLHHQGLKTSRRLTAVVPGQTPCLRAGWQQILSRPMRRTFSP